MKTIFHLLEGQKVNFSNSDVSFSCERITNHVIQYSLINRPDQPAYQGRIQVDGVTSIRFENGIVCSITFRDDRVTFESVRDEKYFDISSMLLEGQKVEFCVGNTHLKLSRPSGNECLLIESMNSVSKLLVKSIDPQAVQIFS